MVILIKKNSEIEGNLFSNTWIEDNFQVCYFLSEAQIFTRLLYTCKPSAKCMVCIVKTCWFILWYITEIYSTSWPLPLCWICALFTIFFLRGKVDEKLAQNQEHYKNVLFCVCGYMCGKLKFANLKARESG